MKLNKNILLMVGLVAVLSFVLFNSSRSQSQSSDEAVNNARIELVNAARFSELSEDPESFLLDVHTPEQTHIPGTDAFIPYNEIAQNLDKLPQDKSTPILVYCRSGSMSAQAAAELSQMGYTNVYDLDGGTDVYKESNVEVAISPDNQDLGTVIYGDVPTTQFTLTNYAPLPIKITRVSTSCGCTKAEVEKTELDAYESTVVKVSFDPAVHGDDTDLGDLTRTIYIDTDNPNFPRLESTITANVIKE